MEKELIKELWQLWGDLAEVGELTINKDFSRKFEELKKDIECSCKMPSPSMNCNCSRCGKLVPRN